MILNKFNPASPEPITDQDIICATSGGINATCVPSFMDLGEDVDNCPNGTKELKRIESYECKMSFTALDATPAVIALSLGAADVAEDKITARADVELKDFKEVWGVFERLDGGMVAVHMSNALSSGGLSIQTAKNEKGQLSVELMGHFAIAQQDVVPMEFYSAAPAAA